MKTRPTRVAEGMKHAICTRHVFRIIIRPSR